MVRPTASNLVELVHENSKPLVPSSWPHQPFWSFRPIIPVMGEMRRNELQSVDNTARTATATIGGRNLVREKDLLWIFCQKLEKARCAEMKGRTSVGKSIPSSSLSRKITHAFFAVPSPSSPSASSPFTAGEPSSTNEIASIKLDDMKFMKGPTYHLLTAKLNVRRRVICCQTTER